jgi:hypothetical protein
LRHGTSGSDGRQPHRLAFDIDARLIAVDLQEHVADAQSRALVMGDDDRDLFHAGHCRGLIIDAGTVVARIKSALRRTGRRLTDSRTSATQHVAGSATVTLRSCGSRGAVVSPANAPAQERPQHCGGIRHDRESRQPPAAVRNPANSQHARTQSASQDDNLQDGG